jgi:hypothetical protein
LGEREGGGFGHFERRRGEVVYIVVARRGETRERRFVVPLDGNK